MRKFFTLLLFLYGFISYSQQQKIQFEYDGAGNQVVRKLCFECLAKNSNEPAKEISDLKQEDLQKFFPQDVISFYPNPVKEQLYLKWELTKDKKVSSVQLYSLNGHLLKETLKLESIDNLTMEFQSYPSGVYILLLIYTDGDQKSIKIIKE